MRLSARRFPDSIRRIRQWPGGYNEHGEYQMGATQQNDLKANVQPLSFEDSETVGGSQIENRLVCYTSGADSLSAAFREGTADVVIWRGSGQGLAYVVESAKPWQGSHTAAVLLRQP